MRNQHTWTEKTPEGERREVRAVKFGGRWKVQSKLRDRLTWTYHEPPLTADLEELRDIIFRKYQRKRVSYDDVQELDRILELARQAEPPPPAPETAP